jgi:hypothetical protein
VVQEGFSVDKETWGLCQAVNYHALALWLLHTIPTVRMINWQLLVCTCRKQTRSTLATSPSVWTNEKLSMQQCVAEMSLCWCQLVEGRVSHTRWGYLGCLVKCNQFKVDCKQAEIRFCNLSLYEANTHLEIMYSVGTVEELLHEEMGEAVFWHSSSQF